MGRIPLSGYNGGIETVQLLIEGLLAVVLLAGVAGLIGAPRAVVLLVGGLAIGFAPGAPEINPDPDLIFLVFLPPLLYVSAFKFATEDVRPNLRSITLLAVGLVLATVLGVAAVAHLVIGLPWAAAFALGAVLGPTDPIAATSTIRRLGAPDRVSTILEGEALVNDGTALTILRVSVAAVGTSFSLVHGIGEFVWTIAAGAGIGVVVGLAGRWLRQRINEAPIEITVALATAYGAFYLADQAGVSGILAAVGAGVAIGFRPGNLASAESRLQGDGFWEVIVFVSESLLFLMVGVTSQQALSGIDNHSALELIAYAVLVSTLVVGLRVAWMFTVPHFVSLLDPRVKGATARSPWRERLALSAGGMRGAVTVAAALSIPVEAGGAPFPDRDLAIFLAYTCVIATLVLPSLALPSILRRLGLDRDEEAREEALSARLKVVHAALSRGEELAGEDGLSEEALSRAREAYELRVKRIESQLGHDEDEGHDLARDYRTVRRELLAAERDQLEELRTDRAVPSDVLRDIERELDLEEARLPEPEATGDQ